MEKDIQYSIVCNKKQLQLIAKALENYSRRLSGQLYRFEDVVIRDLMEDRLFHHDDDPDFESSKFIGDCNYHLKKLKKLLFPEFPDGTGSYGYNHTPEIGNSYQIYRTIGHVLAKEANDPGVFRHPPLPSGDLGTIEVKRLK